MTYPTYHAFIGGMIAGFVLGLGVAFAFCMVCISRQPRPPLTMHGRRRNRDRPVPEVVPPWEREDGVQYRFMGTTGEEA